MRIRQILFYVVIILQCACNDSNDNSDSIIPKKTHSPTLKYEYVNSYPHDTNSFTEGFLIYQGKLYESTGATTDLPQTKSLFGIVDLTTGKIEAKVEIDREKYFGEGIAFLNGKIFQLTYKTKVGFVYDATTFKKIGQFTFPSKEGWGLTTNGTELVMSDGTNKITFIDPNTFQVIKTIEVSENNYVIDYINELEYIKGYIYANIWTTNSIVKIDAESGNVIGRFDLTSLAEEANSIYPPSLEMNGIAYDSIADKIFVTGKMWPKIYEIKFNH